MWNCNSKIRCYLMLKTDTIWCWRDPSGNADFIATKGLRGDVTRTSDGAFSFLQLLATAYAVHSSVLHMRLHHKYCIDKAKKNLLLWTAHHTLAIGATFYHVSDWCAWFVPNAKVVQRTLITVGWTPVHSGVGAQSAFRGPNRKCRPLVRAVVW